MKTVRFKNRIDNAVEAFFAADNSSGNQTLTYRENAALTRNEKSAEFAETGDRLLKILKRTCLFFPGTFFLLLLSFAGSFAFVSRGFHFWVPISGLLTIIFMFFLAGFLTWFGIGDLKNSKHYVIPLSIISVGIVAGFVGGILPKEIVGNLNRDPFWLYFLPLALVAPLLAKGWVDRNKKQIKNIDY